MGPLSRAIRDHEPGLSAEQNFSGASFAVANFTGLICRTMLEYNLTTADQLRVQLKE